MIVSTTKTETFLSNADINLTGYLLPRANRRATNFFLSKSPPRGQLFSTKLWPSGQKMKQNPHPRA